MFIVLFNTKASNIKRRRNVGNQINHVQVWSEKSPFHCGNPSYTVQKVTWQQALLPKQRPTGHLAVSRGGLQANRTQPVVTFIHVYVYLLTQWPVLLLGNRAMLLNNVPVQDFIQRLIGIFITLNPLHEIFYCFLCVTVGVVWASQLHLLNTIKQHEWVARDQKLLLTFNERELTTMFSWMTSGSSHTDSTKNTWHTRERGAADD